MTSRTTIALRITAALVLFALAAMACISDPSPVGELEVTSGRSRNASVGGTVTYRERLALSEGATLIVELRDVSYADAAAPLIARQTIENPGQVPIRFEVGYHRDDLDDRKTYAVSARIVESDGRLAFTNDTAYEVITRGNPRSVDMLLVLVEPPPGSVAEGADWRQWVEAPAQVVLASLIQNEPDHPLRIAYYQPSAEDCARRGEEGWEIRGTEIEAWVTLLQPPPTPWAIDCGGDLLELDTIMVLGPSLVSGLTYEVTVNEVHTATFTLPDGDLPPSVIAESPVERAEVVVGEEGAGSYALNIVSGMPKGGSCSRFNGYEIQRREPYRIHVVVTHHEVVDPGVVCTADYPIVETTVPLGSDFEPGTEYTVTVNSDVTLTFVAE